jgi:hypothetical protein
MEEIMAEHTAIVEENERVAREAARERRAGK